MYSTPQYLQKTTRLMLWLMLLAWATNALFSSSARGEEPTADDAPVAGEKFVPGGARTLATATLELKPEISVIGEEVKLRQVARWADSDKAAFEPIADLVLFRLSTESPFKTVTVRELRDTLRDAGVNLAVLRLAGATTCTAARTDVKFDERTALDQWVAAKELATTKPALIEAPTTRPAKLIAPEAAPAAAIPAAAAVEAPREAKDYKSLRDLLVTEMSERLGVAATQLQFHFNPSDEKLLNLAQPMFQFDLRPPRTKNLGEVTWQVSILADGATQKASITATVRAWQSQLVVNKPLGYRQVIHESDLIDRRTLVDRIDEDPLVTREQVVGQMAGRELKSGTVLTARLIEPTILVKGGQLVSVTLTQGGIQAKSVARATEQGTLGQTIRVKNEVTNNQFDVVITGPQTARLPAGVATDKPNLAAIDR